MSKRGYQGSYPRQRRELLADDPLCGHCGLRPATRADHQPPLSLHEHVDGSGCCTLVPSCLPCEQRQSGLLGGVFTRGVVKIKVEVVEPEGFGVRDPVWDVAPWLGPLRRVPRDAVWPRLMTGPHPRAVDTMGPVFVKWAQQWTGRQLRWFQKLIAYRMLEVDAAGQLVWEQIIVSMARQVGKSYLLRLLALWRILHADVFGGDPQLVLHTASTLQVAREVILPAQTWAQALPDEYKVRFANGEIEICRLVDGSRWLVRATRSLVGYSAALAICDEAFDVAEELITEGLEPTTAAIDNSQLLLVSTANSHPKDLMPNRRAAALSTLHDPGVDLLIEWSTPRNIDIWDRKAWRQASPFWSERRERLIERKLRDADAKGEGLETVAAQWFCWWPPKATPPVKGDLLIGDDWDRWVWDADTVGPLVLIVEDHFGRGAAGLAAGVTDDERFSVGGWEFASRVEAFDWVGYWARQRPGSMLVVGASLKGDPAIDGIDVAEVRTSGTAETRVGLPLLRDLVAAGRVVHDGSTDLRGQVVSARVTESSTGLHLLPTTRQDLTRALCWAAHILEHDRPSVPTIW